MEDNHIGAEERQATDVSWRSIRGENHPVLDLQKKGAEGAARPKARAHLPARLLIHRSPKRKPWRSPAVARPAAQQYS